MYANNNGQYEFYNVTMHHNYALSNSISEVFNTALDSTLDNCSIYENEIISIADFEEELNITCQKL